MNAVIKFVYTSNSIGNTKLIKESTTKNATKMWMKYKTTFKIKPPFTPAKDLAIFSKIITKTLSKLLLKKLVNVLHQLDKLILTFITKLNLNKI